VLLGPLLAPIASWADGFTTKAGTLGILDVPTTETMGVGGGWLSLDLFVEHQATRGWSVAPLPLVIVGGLADSLDLGLAIRDSGLPGDPVPTFPMLTVTGKYAFLRARGFVPGLAVTATLDRINWKVESSLRVVASTAYLGPLRLSLFGGASLTELTVSTLAPIGGLALALRHSSGLEFVADGLRTAGGWLVGGGLRWAITDHVGLSLAASWKPDDNAIRAMLGVSVFTGVPTFEAPPTVLVPKSEGGSDTTAGPRRYLDPKPHFRLKIHQSTRIEGAGRHVQNTAEESEDETESAPARPPVPGAPAPTPELPAATPPVPTVSP
jgi:hypothetical protein